MVQIAAEPILPIKPVTCGYAVQVLLTGSSLRGSTAQSAGSS
jgi:hypothetical protein